jgi:hypothetical protein
MKEGDMKKCGLISEMVFMIGLTCFSALLVAQGNNQANKNNSDEGNARSEGETYRFLIVLTSGFNEHAVTITVDDRKVCELSSVTSISTLPPQPRLQPVFIKADTTSQKVKVVVSVEPGGYKDTIEVDVTQFPYLAVSLSARDGKIIFRKSKEVIGFG